MLLKLKNCTLLVLMFLSTTTLAAPPEGKGKTDPPEDPVELPNIRYSVTIRSMPSNDFSVNNINNAAVFCGRFTPNAGQPREGFVYVPPTPEQPDGVFYHLNQLGLQSKLDEQTSEANWGTGWSFANVLEINDLGDFVGYLYPPDYSPDQPVAKGFLIETSSSPDPDDWTVRLLPTFGSDIELGIDLNELGIVLGQYERPDGTYEMYLYDSLAPDGAGNPQTLNLPDSALFDGMLNNFGKVVGRASGLALQSMVFEYDPLISPDVDVYQLGDYAEGNSNFSGLNDSGDTSGKTYLELPKPKGKGTTLEAVVFNTNALNGFAIVDPSTATWGKAGLNESGDIHFTETAIDVRIAHLAHTGIPAGGSLQVWTLNDLIDETDPFRDQWLQLRQSVLGITNRDATGYPTLAGEVNDENGNYAIFVLRPFVPEP